MRGLQGAGPQKPCAVSREARSAGRARRRETGGATVYEKAAERFLGALHAPAALDGIGRHARDGA